MRRIFLTGAVEITSIYRSNQISIERKILLRVQSSKDKPSFQDCNFFGVTLLKNIKMTENSNLPNTAGMNATQLVSMAPLTTSNSGKTT